MRFVDRYENDGKDMPIDAFARRYHPREWTGHKGEYDAPVASGWYLDVHLRNVIRFNREEREDGIENLVPLRPAGMV